jgi:hypothetical protein
MQQDRAQKVTRTHQTFMPNILVRVGLPRKFHVLWLAPCGGYDGHGVSWRQLIRLSKQWAMPEAIRLIHQFTTWTAAVFSVAKAIAARGTPCPV